MKEQVSAYPGITEINGNASRAKAINYIQPHTRPTKRVQEFNAKGLQHFSLQWRTTGTFSIIRENPENNNFNKERMA